MAPADDDRSRVSIEARDAPSSSYSIRYSLASTETGESSKSASTGHNSIDIAAATRGPALQVPKRNDVRRRSHKSSSAGSFLLYKPAAGTAVRSEVAKGALRLPTKDTQGKHVIRSKNKRPQNEVNGENTSRSPLSEATDSTSTPDIEAPTEPHVASAIAPQKHAAVLDEDARQIINLALGLSERRRLAQRRNFSNPNPPPEAGEDLYAGNSLRQAMQQQRRVSRNISPKPDKSERSSTAMSNTRQSLPTFDSPLRATFDMAEEDEYKYHFTTSTLARAAKAKKAIELMAQYRRLLQYVPPLSPTPTSATLSPRKSARNVPFNSDLAVNVHAPGSRGQSCLGREYNPLQYIRNRTVRARERKTIDGEADGYGDLDLVVPWVDRVADSAAMRTSESHDCVVLPSLKPELDQLSPAPSDHSSSTSKQRPRPRVGWLVNPADMLADIAWLEKGENKKSIEDSQWRKIFPQHHALSRPETRESDISEIVGSSTMQPGRSRPATQGIQTQLPSFAPLHKKIDSHGVISHHSDDRHAPDVDFNKVSRYRHEQDFSGHGSRSRSGSQSPAVETFSNDHQPKHAGTANNDQFQIDILARQMKEILIEESRESSSKSGPLDKKGQKIVDTIDSAKPRLQEELERRRNVSQVSMSPPSRREKQISVTSSDDSHRTSARGSLDMQGARSRRSYEGISTTASNSSLTRAQIAKPFVPPMGMPLSSSPASSRQHSPSRNIIHKVRSKIPFTREKTPPPVSRQSSYIPESADMSPMQDNQISTPAVRIRQRSLSPMRGVTTRRTDESFGSARSNRWRGDAPSGIKALFKSGRNNVSKIGDMVGGWRTTSAAVSSDDVSDDEKNRTRMPQDRARRINDRDIEDDLRPTMERQSLDMPSFTSPFERHGKDRRIRSDEYNPTDSTDGQMTARQRHDSRRMSRLDLLRPPNIRVNSVSPASSPDVVHGLRRRLSGVSDISDLSRQDTNVREADDRLNAILGMPGRHRAFADEDYLPHTALSPRDHEDARRHSTASGITRHWSISDNNTHNGAPSPGMGQAQTTSLSRHSIARVRALLLSSGIKAQEISTRANDVRDISKPDPDPVMRRSRLVSDIVQMARARPGADKAFDDLLVPVVRKRQHAVACRILETDINLSTRAWESAVESFSDTKVNAVLDRIDALQTKIAGLPGREPNGFGAESQSKPGSKYAEHLGLSEIVKRAADEADEVSRDLVLEKTMMIKELMEKMDRLMRRRRRRFRWVRRGGWVVVEWILVAIMWAVWAVVVLLRLVRGVILGPVQVGRWLLWL